MKCPVNTICMRRKRINFPPDKNKFLEFSTRSDPMRRNLQKILSRPDPWVDPTRWHLCCKWGHQQADAVNSTVDTCALTECGGGLQSLHEVKDNARKLPGDNGDCSTREMNRKSRFPSCCVCISSELAIYCSRRTRSSQRKHGEHCSRVTTHLLRLASDVIRHLAGVRNELSCPFAMFYYQLPSLWLIMYSVVSVCQSVRNQVL